MTSRENAEAADRALELERLRAELERARESRLVLDELAARGANYRLAEATALLERIAASWTESNGEHESIREAYAFLSRAPAQAEPTVASGAEEWVCTQCPERNVTSCDQDRCCNCCGCDLQERGELLRWLGAESAETEVRELRAQLEEARNDAYQAHAAAQQQHAALESLRKTYRDKEDQWRRRQDGWRESSARCVAELRAQLEAVRELLKEFLVESTTGEDEYVSAALAIISPQAPGTEER